MTEAEKMAGRALRFKDGSAFEQKQKLARAKRFGLQTTEVVEEQKAKFVASVARTGRPFV